MPQKLILPIDNARLNAGYKSDTYRSQYGWQHYGWDLTDAGGYRPLNGMGKGVVVAAGLDGENTASRLGYVLVMVFRDVLLRDGRIVDLTCRMTHLRRTPGVLVGDEIDHETIVASYGGTGDPASVDGDHLHIEFDLDTKWACLAPGVSLGKGKIINTAQDVKAAGGVADTTISPALVFWPAEHQSISGREEWMRAGWFSEEELNFTVQEKAPEANAAAFTAKVADMEAEADSLGYKARYDSLVAHLRAVFETIQRE